MNKIINSSVVVGCSVKKAFALFTHKEKVETWLCDTANIALEVGGQYELYNEQDKDDHTEGCSILALDAPNYLTVEWKGPLKFSELMNLENSLTQVSILFHPKGKYTQVTVQHTGWGVGAAWDEAFFYFQNAWDVVLVKLKSVISSEGVLPKIGVTGLGGMFFKSENPDLLKKWYDKHLGFETDAYGQAFRWVQFDNPHKTGSTQWSVMPADTAYFSPSEKAYMLNYRVGDLVALLEKLKAADVEIAGEMESYDYGKFGWVVDPEGNKIELWEPVDEVFDNYYDQ
jgi:uncharacterized protein YndB with AHSA1/START domain/predicted enzyme related to lactoylglutathione lyase